MTPTKEEILELARKLYLEDNPNAPTPEEEEPSTDLDVYGGSNPVGDFVVIEINKTDQKLKYHNYTKDKHTGWFDYAKVTDPAENMGFDIIYKVAILYE